jgi:flagellar biosynthetic protein FliO
MSDKTVGTKKKIIVAISTIVLCGSLLVFRSAQSDTKALVMDNKISDPCQPAQSTESNLNYLFAKDSDDRAISGYNNIGGELYSKSLLAVLFVLVLGAAAIYVSKKLLPKITNLPGKEIHIVETVHLGPRKAVHLLEISGRRFLIGSTNETINTLADLNSTMINQLAPDTEINFEKINAQQSY